jgi:hypothetical protein
MQKKKRKNRVIGSIETWALVPDSQAMLPVPENAFVKIFLKKTSGQETWTLGRLLNVHFSFTHSHKENSAQEHRF